MPPVHFALDFGDEFSWTICLGWPSTFIFLISASQVVRITGMSHCHLARHTDSFMKYKSMAFFSGEGKNKFPNMLTSWLKIMRPYLFISLQHLHRTLHLAELIHVCKDSGQAHSSLCVPMIWNSFLSPNIVLCTISTYSTFFMIFFIPHYHDGQSPHLEAPPQLHAIRIPYIS
jgi:hypothetical protein